MAACIHCKANVSDTVSICPACNLTARACPLCDAPIQCDDRGCAHCKNPLFPSAIRCSACSHLNPLGAAQCEACQHPTHSDCWSCGKKLENKEAVCPSCLSPIRIDAYPILTRLGKGTFGAVFLGYHERLGQSVAIKLLWESFAEDQGFLKRFQDEGKVAAKLGGSAHIVRVTDSGVFKNRPYLIMEFEDAGNLQQLVQLKTFVDPGLAVRLSLQACEALRDLHNIGFIHRDVKPSNILLRKVARKTIAKLADLGIVTSQSSPQGATTGLQFASIPWTAPEQITMQRSQLDARVDLFALGSTMYYMLSGRQAFEVEDGSSSKEMAYVEAVRLGARPLSQVRPQLLAYPELESLVMRLISSNRDDRPKNAEQVYVEILKIEQKYFPPSDTTLRERTSKMFALRRQQMPALQQAPKRSLATKLLEYRAALIQSYSGLSSPQRMQVWMLAALTVILLGVVAAYALRKPKPAPPAVPVAPSDARTPAELAREAIGKGDFAQAQTAINLIPDASLRNRWQAELDAAKAAVQTPVAPPETPAQPPVETPTPLPAPNTPPASNAPPASNTPPASNGDDINTKLSAALNRGDFAEAFQTIKIGEGSGQVPASLAQSLRQQTFQQAVRYIDTQLGRGNLDRRIKLLDLIRPYGDVSPLLQKVQVDWEAQLANELNTARDNMEYNSYRAKVQQLKGRFPNSAEAERLLAAINQAQEEMEIRKKARKQKDD
jgi:serine/threonine protein kinase